MGTHQELEMFEVATTQRNFAAQEGVTESQLINIQVELSQAATVTLCSHPSQPGLP